MAIIASFMKYDVDLFSHQTTAHSDWIHHTIQVILEQLIQIRVGRGHINRDVIT